MATTKSNFEMLGVDDGAAVTTDADGTLQQYLRGLVKLMATTGDVAAATVLGTTADAGVVTDAVGTISAKARGLVTLLLAVSANMAKLEARAAQPNMLVAPAVIAIGTGTAVTGSLTVGTTYMVYASAPCFVKVGANAVTAALTDVYLEPGMVFCWTPTVSNTDTGIACIGAVAGGSVYVQACQA